MVRAGTTAKQKTLFFSPLSRLLAQEAAGLETRLADFARRSGHRMADILTVARRMTARDRSLHEPAGADHDGAAALIATLADERPDPEQRLAEVSERRLIAAAIAQGCAKLAPRELHIIRRRYLAQASMTLEAVARELDLSKERVRQLEREALAKLRETIAPLLRRGMVRI
jgi:RNA polymerase sigma-32 factor